LHFIRPWPCIRYKARDGLVSKIWLCPYNRGNTVVCSVNGWGIYLSSLKKSRLSMPCICSLITCIDTEFWQFNAIMLQLMLFILSNSFIQIKFIHFKWFKILELKIQTKMDKSNSTAVYIFVKVIYNRMYMSVLSTKSMKNKMHKQWKR